MKNAGRWLVYGLLIFALAACSVPGPSGKNENQSGEKKKAVNKIDPLTGLTTGGAEHPVLMVMLNNHRNARPQTGLDRADIVVEILAEGEITRFAAFYHSQTGGKVGPVRSVRNYYLDLAEGADAVVAHAGGAKDALARIEQENIPGLDGIHEDARYFSRVSFRKPPHNLYTDLERLYEAVREQGYQSLPVKKAYQFSKTAETGQRESAGRIDLDYHPLYKAGYEYDSASKSYIRYTEGVRQVDRETKQPLSMQNVLVVFAKHQIVDSVGHRTVAVKASGRGYLFQQGKALSIEWRYRDGWIIPFAGGKEVPMLPGKTWVNVLPETGRVSFQ
ncbi:DUF3048 domain-containing protein [Paenactinomyces guangxiensis]|nr:DUF3048 domain-containing protein [Paenactinomyces guangxiensis]